MQDVGQGVGGPKARIEEGCHLAGSLDCILETRKPWNRDRTPHSC